MIFFNQLHGDIIMEENEDITHQNPIPLKISSKYKIILKNYLNSIKKNFRMNVKQGDVLKLMIEVLKDNNFILKMHNLKVNKPNSSEIKDVFVVYEETKKALDSIIEQFDHVFIEEADSHVNFKADIDRKYNHNLNYDQYIGYIIRLFEYRMNTMSSEEIEKITLNTIKKK